MSRFLAPDHTNLAVTDYRTTANDDAHDPLGEYFANTTMMLRLHRDVDVRSIRW